MKKLTQSEFIVRCNKIHNNKFDYSNTKYINIRSKISIVCQVHGEFDISADNHLLQKQGCVKCAQEKHKLTQLSSDRIKNLTMIHNKYLYSDTSITNGFINISCRQHGKFKQYLYFHEYGHGCPECNSSSRGEDRIKNYLNDNNIKFNRNHQFEDCKRTRKLKFDFYLPETNIIIEYDGEHHYKENSYFGEGNLEYVKENDMIKDNYCKENNINLIRIPYWEYKNIESILSNIKQNKEKFI